MTVTYSLDISTASVLSIHKLLFRWKGSVWKAIIPELILWIIFYFILSAVYRYALTVYQQSIFEDISEFCYTFSSYIPITFMLGFYVSIVFTRWKDIFSNIGWIDNAALLLTVAIKGNDELARNIRRNIVRYIILVQALVFRKISSNVKRRFPTMEHLVTAGLMTENELREFEDIVSSQMKYWVPINWCFALCRKAREMNMIDSDYLFVDVMDKIKDFRSKSMKLFLYDWVPIPLVYTQTVNITVRCYFLIALMARQYLLHVRNTPNSKTIDMYFPLFTVLQITFFIGWMKVAEVMLNPFGDDDDDFECNWIIDRNLQVGLVIADSYGRLPKIERDMFWEDILPEPLYTAESFRPHNYVGSCVDLKIDPQKRRLSNFVLPNKFRFDQNNVKDDEINIIQHNPKKFMTTGVISSDKVRYTEPNEEPVVKSNQERRGSILETDFDKSPENVKYNRIQPRLHRDASDSIFIYNRSNNDNTQRIRRYSDNSYNVNPKDMNTFIKQQIKNNFNEENKSGSELSIYSKIPSPTTNKAFIVDESLPPIQEEEYNRSRLQALASSTVPSFHSMISNENDGDNKKDLVIKESFERLKTLLNDTTTDTLNAENNKTELQNNSPFQYENFGFYSDSEDKVSPNGGANSESTSTNKSKNKK